ncbi:MAG TPA: hypothetical protein PKM43_21015 [Verrucomicrobiota bacterium]|nr:hypothetical protein [Verrucomicrobiota bacterium]
MRNMVKKLVIAVGLAVSMAANAAVMLYNTVDTPLSYSMSIDYDRLDSTEHFYFEFRGNWFCQVGFIPFSGGTELVAGRMYHLVAPHVGDLAPNPNDFEFSFWVTGGILPIPNPGVVTKPHPNGGHFDTFSATIGPSIQGPAPAYSLTLTGSHPVPEPQQFALFAGLGLLAFGAYRRMKS